MEVCYDLLIQPFQSGGYENYVYSGLVSKLVLQGSHDDLFINKYIHKYIMKRKLFS